jgi:hypothetical protein
MAKKKEMLSNIKTIHNFLNGTASARTSDPGASIRRIRDRTIQMRERISR